MSQIDLNQVSFQNDGGKSIEERKEIVHEIESSSLDNYIIEGNIFAFRPLNPLLDDQVNINGEDFKLFQEIYSSQTNCSLVVPERDGSDKTIKQMIKKHRDLYDETGMGLGVIVDKKTGESIGLAGLTPMGVKSDKKQDPLELNIALKESKIHKGIGSSVVKDIRDPLLDFIFESLSCKIVYTEALPYNLASQKLSSSLGFSSSGVNLWENDGNATSKDIDIAPKATHTCVASITQDEFFDYKKSPISFVVEKQNQNFEGQQTVKQAIEDIQEFQDCSQEAKSSRLAKLQILEPFLNKPRIQI